MSNMNGAPLVQTATAINRRRVGKRRKELTTTRGPKWFIRYAYYGFVFSLPFEAVDIGTEATITRFFGLALVALALLQPRLCFKRPPKAFWWFAVYLLVYASLGSFVIFDSVLQAEFASQVIHGFILLAKLLALFWISYNLMQHERIIKNFLVALAGATIILAILQFLGITATMGSGQRISAFGQNPNLMAMTLSFGLLALVGLAYTVERRDLKARLFFWLFSAVVLIGIVQSGSRGTTLALIATLSILFLKGKGLLLKLKLGSIALVGVVILGVASYQIDAVRTRWEKTLYEGSLAGREEIFPISLRMILEKPLTGWGPVVHKFELGSRRGEWARAHHNLYLTLLAEGGLLGAIPFLVGLWLCWCAAWRARHGIQGILPVLMLFFLLVINLKSTGEYQKLFWVVLSYGLASGSYAAVIKPRKTAVPSQNRGSPHFIQRGPAYRPSRTSKRDTRKFFGGHPHQ